MQQCYNVHGLLVDEAATILSPKPVCFTPMLVKVLYTQQEESDARCHLNVSADALGWPHPTYRGGLAGCRAAVGVQWPDPWPRRRSDDPVADRRPSIHQAGTLALRRRAIVTHNPLHALPAALDTALRGRRVACR